MPSCEHIRHGGQYLKECIVYKPKKVHNCCILLGIPYAFIVFKQHLSLNALSACALQSCGMVQDFFSVQCLRF